MASLRMKIGKLNIFTKLVSSFLLALIPILIISYLMNGAGETSVRKDISSSLASSAHFYMDSFEKEMERIIALTQVYMFDEDIQRLAAQSSIMTDNELRLASLNVESRLMLFKTSSLYVDEVKVFIPPVRKIIQTQKITYEIPEIELNVLDKLFKRESPIVRWQGQLLIGDRFPAYQPQDQTPLFWIEAILSTARLESSLRQITGDGKAVLIGPDNEWEVYGEPGQAEDLAALSAFFASRPAGAPNEGEGSVRIGGETYFISYERSNLLNATLAVYVPERQLLGPLSIYRMLFWILTITSICIVFLFSSWIYQLIHKPIYRLVGAFRKLDSNRFDIELRHRNNDEFQYLYRQFNETVGRIQHLIRDVYEKEIHARRAELKQLQTQINPHFLYNSFFQLNRMAQNEDHDNVKTFTRHLGQYFQYVTRNALDEVQLVVEVKHAQAYVAIQMMRFSNQIELHWEELPPRCGQVQVPRLILQPIVENAFEYALEDRTGKGKLIFLVQELDDELLLVVEDNGTELTDETLTRLNRQLCDSAIDAEVTGLHNVHRRLQIKFGPRYGLHFARSAFGGLRVEIRIPL